MNSEREDELMTRARVLALAQTELNILPKLRHLQGEALQTAEAQLAAIRDEREHLDALLRHDPAALAREQERLRQVDREFERAIEARNQEALTTPLNRLPLAAARLAVASDLDALRAIEGDSARFAALATMGSSADEQRPYREALEASAPDLANAAILAHAAVTHAWEVMQAERGAAIQAAEYAVSDYIGAAQSTEYAYLDTFNPEGKPAAYFHEQARLTRTDMMKALAALPDDDAATVLAKRQAVDHDFSTYPVADLAEVRAYRAVLTGRDDPAQTVTAAERQCAAAEIHHQLVSTTTSDLKNAIEWGYEPEFNDVFEAAKSNPAIDATAAAEIAKALTRQPEDWPTKAAALGAIETEFYAQAHAQQQRTTARGR